MKRHALFVGVNDYADMAFKNLRYSLSDAVALSGAFAARGFDVEVLSNPKAETVLGAVERKAAGLGLGDVFLFFFAGHGFTAPDGSHLLICSNDRLAYLRHNRAGIPVDLLEEITNGRGCNRAFLLDACRTDVFAGVENRGAETRDLAFISLPDAKVHAGTCCVLRSCDRFCPAMEFDDLGHGVFTRAVMDVLGDDSFCATPFGEAFVAGIRSRMHVILSAHSVVGNQNPCFQTNGEAFFLFDSVVPQPPQHQQPSTAPSLVVCPVCGKKNDPRETFTCRECGRDNLCLRHQDETTFLCSKCAAAQRKEREEAERKARKEKKPTREETGRQVPQETGRKAGKVKTIILPGGEELRLRWCPAGTFMMGSPESEKGRYEDETRHRVTLTQGFWLGETPVTRKQWKSVMEKRSVLKKIGDTLKLWTTEECPVGKSWKDCQEFIERLNGELDCGARLPTEAEWEYACRAGTKGKYAGTGELDNMGWYDENSEGSLQPVGQKTPNAWGLCDMHGNVYEWCADRYGDYPSGSVVNPQGPATGTRRVMRGGCFDQDASTCRSAYRYSTTPGSCNDRFGFRLCCSAGPRG